MGYTSDVCIAVYGDPLSLSAHIAKWKDSIGDAETLEWINRNEVKPEDDQRAGATGLYRLEFHDVKWYEAYTDVQRVMRLVEDLDESETDALTGEFVRLGESDDDFERKAYGDVDANEYRYQLSREIIFD